MDTSQLHNDSTSISVHGAYHDADGTARAGKATPVITHGHSKDHRPDLKQLVWILTVSADGAVPIAYRLADGNTVDDPTHIPTWDGLVALLGRVDFLYVADSKLCSRQAMGHIAGRGGRFVTVMPRSRREDKAFRDWMQTHTPVWPEAARRPGPRLGEPDEVYATTPALAPSAEGYRILWVHSSAKAGRDSASRMARTEAGIAAIDALDAKLAGPRNRHKTRAAVAQAATAALAQARADRWVTFTIGQTTTKTYKQGGPGRPSTATNYREVLTTRYTLTADIDLERIAYDAVSDGCFPLITCDRDLPDAAVLAAYRYQPNLERRHHLLKSVQDAAPVLLHRVAKDRVISTVDPETRHGHKTAARGFDGYKGHIGIDPESEIITATTVTAGNAGDASVAEDLIADLLEEHTEDSSTETGEDTATVYGDNAYGTGSFHDRLEQDGIEYKCKSQQPVNSGGRFNKNEFGIDLEQHSVTCPAGNTAPIRYASNGAGTADFGQACAGCPLREQCTTSGSGRTIMIGLYERQLAAARDRQRDPDWIADYRATRPKVERKIGHLMRRRHGGRARVRGQTKVTADFSLLAAAVNVARLGVLGLTSTGPGSWAAATS